MERDLYLHPLLRRPMTRRSMLRGAGAALGAAVLGANLIGCGRPSSEQSTPSAGVSAIPTPSGPRRGGTVTICVPAQMTDLQPQLGGGSSEPTNRHVYDHLFNSDYVNGKYELSLAQSLENPDPLTYIFKIKPNAKHQNIPPVDGRVVSSDDVVASWQAFVANPRTANKALFANIDRYETPDPSTLVVRLKKPNAWVLGPHGFGGPLPSVVMPKELIERDLLAKTAIGPGAFVLEEFDPASVLSFKRRPDAWHEAERPYVDRVVIRVITDEAARAAALKAKQIDLLAARDKLQAEEFKTYGSDMLIDKELTFPAMLFIRADAEGVFKDARVREAVYNALDIKELIDRVELGEAEYCGPVQAHLKIWAMTSDEVKKYFPKDLNKAKQLLAAADWDSNKEVEFKYPASPKASLLAEVLQKQLAAAGIRTKLVPEDSTTVWYTQTALGRNFQLTATPLLYQSQDPDLALRIFTTAGIGGGNTARWSDPEVDEIVGRVATEFDAEKQKTIISEAQKTILKKFSPIINLYAPYAFTGRWSYFHYVSPSVKGYAALYGHYSWTEKS